MEPIGRIYGEVVGSDFKFASRKYYSCKYVRTQNRHDDSIIIGKVTEVRVKNHFLEHMRCRACRLPLQVPMNWRRCMELKIQI